MLHVYITLSRPQCIDRVHLTRFSIPGYTISTFASPVGRNEALPSGAVKPDWCPPSSPDTIIIGNMTLRLEESDHESQLCANCAVGPGKASFEDSLPNFPKLLKSNCDLCKFLRNIMLSKEANVPVLFNNLTPSDDRTLPVTITWVMVPKCDRMQLFVRLHSLQRVRLFKFSGSVTSMSGNSAQSRNYTNIHD